MRSILISLAIFALNITYSLAGSCEEAKLCCPGRDSSCVVQKAPLNAIIEDLTDKPCYCDHACLKLGDCCPDFKDACGVADCAVSGWGAWSACSAGCGAGSVRRERQVLRQPKHGGRRCPGLTQQRACHATHACRDDADIHASRETALLLPSAMSYSRHVNETHDIRKNLRMRDPEDPTTNPHKEYCIEFDVIKASKACQKDSDYKNLKEGNKVCVRCESEALRRNLAWRCSGHGAFGRATRFAALTPTSCHGQWTRATRRAPAHETHDTHSLRDTCDTDLCRQPDNFIFV